MFLKLNFVTVTILCNYMQIYGESLVVNLISLKVSVQQSFKYPLTHWYKKANGEYSTDILKCLKVSAQQSFRPNSIMGTKLLMVSTQQTY